MKTISSENNNHREIDPFDFSMNGTDVVSIAICIRNRGFASPKTMKPGYCRMYLRLRAQRSLVSPHQRLHFLGLPLVPWQKILLD